MFGKRIKLFTVKKVPVEISIWSVVLAGILILPTIPTVFLGFVVGTGLTTWLDIPVLLLGIFVSILLHELAHALVGISFGSTVTAIHLNLFGGATFFAAKAPAYFKDLLIFLAGPLSNLFLWQLFSLLAQPFDGGSTLAVVISYLAVFNLFLAIFNALPAYPLDGGQAAYAFIMSLTASPRFASWTLLVSSLSISGFIIINQDKLLSGDPITTLAVWYTALWIVLSCLPLLSNAASIAAFYPLPDQQFARFKKNAERWHAARNGPAFFELGKKQAASKQLEYALVSFTQALELEPDNLAYLEARAEIYIELEEYTQALADYNLLLKSPASKPQLFVRRAQALGAMGNFNAAFADLDRVLTLNPQDIEALVLENKLRTSSARFAPAYSWAGGVGPVVGTTVSSDASAALG